MRFDDRLTTVLGVFAEGPHERSVQWRQLVELIARGAAREQPSLREQALAKIASLMREVPEEVRAAAARSIAGPDVPAELVALFAADNLEVAAPLLTAAELGAGGWAAVRAVASPSVAAMLAALRPEPPQPAPALPQPVPTLPQPQPRPDPVEPLPELASVVPVEVAQTDPSPERRSAPLPAGMFRWECGPGGEIDWVEGAPRAALIGRSLADELARRFAERLPFENEPMQLSEAGALAGEWRWSGTPAFFPETGRFAGYHGVARREGAVAQAATVTVPLDSDSLRELVHELRTPLNAIIGFGEIIGGQYLGPAHRSYRDRAAGIVQQARRLVEAVEDLDVAARLQSGRGTEAAGEAVDTLFAPLRLELLERAVQRDLSLTIALRAAGGRSMVQKEVAQRLLRRFLFAIVDAAGPGERLELVIDRMGRHVAVAMDRPEVAWGLSEEQLMDPAVEPGGIALALGFSLRLVRSLAAVSGGAVDIGADRVVLLLPALDA